MLRVYSCIAHDHDLRLVGVAAVICLLAAFIALSAFRQTSEDPTRRFFGVALAGLVAGLGIWATHFVAMLAYQPQLPIGYDLQTTALSVVAAVLITGIGWAVALDRRPAAALLAGAIIGGGVASMHYIGMSAVQLAGRIVWDSQYVTASVLLGVALAAGAVWVHRTRPRAMPWAATLLLTAAICTLHFTAMAAATIYPDSRQAVPVESIDSRTLAFIIAAATLLILAVGFGLLLFDRRLTRAKLAEAQHRAALADEVVRAASERESLNAEVSRQADLRTAALSNMAQGLSIYDEQNRLVAHNELYAQLYDIPSEMLVEGIAFDEIIGFLIEQGTFPGTLEQWTSTTRNSSHEASDSEVQLLTGRIIEIKRRPIPGRGWLATHEDVTDARRAAEKMAYVAAHDVLTGLPNRVEFADRMAAAFAAAGPETRFALHTIDLDRFKEVNDTLGHPIGDQILKQAAARLSRLAPESAVVTRLGGDEFALLQTRVDDRADAASLADKVIEALRKPFEFDGHTVVIGASVGISLAPDDATSGDELLKMSDLALYRAKDQSRGMCRFFEPGMDLQLRERRHIEADLRVAIQEGQFEVHYQPVLNLTSRRITAFEALVRWRHPVRGLVQPAEFIAIAEDTGLILPIGEWVLRQACRDAAAWPEDIGLAVNLSPAQFKRGDLVALTVSALAAAGLKATRLEVEITESVLLHDEVWVRSVLDQLTVLGVRIAMDDFGTGYSSLSYLRSFPFTKIKIDRSFVSDIIGNVDALAIVQATIQLSEKLGMETTAEGVETAEQLRVLALEGCTQAQGYHIGVPVPVGVVPALLGQRNAVGSRAA